MDKTKIQWTDATWNPVRGCSRVSAGCDNCYAMRQAHRSSGPGGAYEGLTRIGKRGVDWAGVARFIPEALDQPLRWKRPRRIFVNSMSDLFHESLQFEEIAAVWGVMHEARQHTFQVLTKRPKRAQEFFGWLAAEAAREGQSSDLGIVCQRWAHTALEELGGHNRYPLHAVKGTFRRWPWPSTNVWLGVSTEDQATADRRIPLLLGLPAAVRFISAEPLLGPLQLDVLRTGDFDSTNALTGEVSYAGRGSQPGHTAQRYRRGIDWVIVGGESGNGARPCALEWLERVVEQCKAANVPVFVKQLGAFVVSEQRAYLRPDLTLGTDEEAKRELGIGSRWLWRAGLAHRKGGDINEFPESLQVREFPNGW